MSPRELGRRPAATCGPGACSPDVTPASAMLVCDLIDQHHDDVVAEWASEARALHGSARSLPSLALLDHMPELLVSLASWLRDGQESDERSFDTSAISHALERLAQDVRLRDVVDEYRILRAVVQRRFLREASSDIPDLVRFNEAIDQAIAVAVSHYAQRREHEVRSEAIRLRVALSASRLGTWEWHPATRRAQWDDRMRAIFKVAKGRELVGEAYFDLMPAEDRARVERAIDQLESADEFEVEHRIVVERVEKWVRIAAAVAERDADHRPTRVVGTALDVTAEKRAQMREQLAKRELEAFARIGAALMETRTFDDFLTALLGLFMQASPDVDTATILLCQSDEHGRGGELLVKASIGLEDETRRGYTIPVGKGFAGTIAATRRPLLLHDAAQSELVISEWVRKRGIRALYGVPLLSSGELVGVAHIGSRVVTDFEDEQKRLFSAMAERAANAIAQAALRDQIAKNNAQLEAVMAALPDALFVADRENVLYANPAATDILGVKVRRELPRAIDEIRRQVRPRDAASGAELPADRLPLVLALRGERPVEHLVARHAQTGHDLHLRVAAAPVLLGEDVVGAVSVWTDISHLVELEEQRDAFMNAVVHDLRNPLDSIVTAAHVVSRKISGTYGDAWAVDRLQRIVTNALRLDRLLRDLLEVALAKSGRIEIQPTVVPITDILDEQVAIWAATSTRHTLRVHACDVQVLADRDRVIEVLDNLIGNAIKYAPGGGSIEIACSARDGEAIVTVRDEGVGIAPEEQRRIFDAYTRAGRNAWAAGHGLGLFISSEIVRKHGGRMGVRSEVGKGSEFWFTLPLAKAAEQEHAVH